MFSSVSVRVMRLALELAEKGIGGVEPNPAVGCIIVKNNKIIGKGYHKKFGDSHAEINALKNCKISPAGATMFVTLEPCCHHGKTPPCTDAIIKAGIKKVVAAIADPTKKVSGKGFKTLKKAGIEIETGICKKQAQELNAPFFKFAKTNKPWVIVKWAQSKDGFLARTDKKRWITNPKCRKDVQKIRKRTQAILVGINTVLQDNPLLTVRPDTNRQPLRVVLDSHFRTPLNSNLIKTSKKIPVCIFTADKKTKNKNGINLKAVLAELGRRNIQQILVEGGQKVITSFLKQNLADEIIIYTSNEKLGKKGKVKISQIMSKTYTRLKNCGDKKRFGTNIRLKSLSTKR